MNILIYISGWFLGLAVFNSVVHVTDRSTNRPFFAGDIMKVIIWTMMWVWICWKFIS